MTNFRVSLINSKQKKQGDFMLNAAITFFVIALVAFLLGATGFAGVSMEIGRTLLFVFLVLAVISFVISMIRGKSPRI